MNATKKFSLILLSVILALLTACSFTSASLPKFDGETEDVAEEDGIVKFEELTGEDFDFEIKNYSGFTAETDKNGYDDYVQKCEQQFTSQGQKSDGNVHAALFSDETKPGVMILVCYEEGKIYVLQFEFDGDFEPQEAFAEWPSADIFAYFHVNLTEPEGVKIRHALFSSHENDSNVPYTILDIVITEGNLGVYTSLKNEIIQAGYTLGKMEEPDGEIYTYSAAMVKNGVEYTAHIDFRPAQENSISIYFENTTMRYELDYGKSPVYVFDEATVGIKTSGNRYQPDESGNEVLARFEECSYYSFSEKYFLEWYGERLDDKQPPKDPMNPDDDFVIKGIEDYIKAHGGWLIEIGTDNQYNVFGDYKHKSQEHTSDNYTTKTYASRRGITDVSRYFNAAFDLQKTGSTVIIAGIECAEYVGKTGVVDGEFISWDATYYVWEEYGMPMKYVGKQYWNGEQLDYTAEIVYLDSTSVAEKYAAYPVEGELVPFPKDKVTEASGLDFIPAVDGAEGYSTSKIGVTLADKNLTLTRFDAHGVSHTEFENYKAAIINAGFKERNEKLYYDLGNNTRVVMELWFLDGEDTAYFYFYTEEYDPLSQPTVPTVSGKTFIFVRDDLMEKTVYMLEFDEDKIYVQRYSSDRSHTGYVYVKSGDTYEKFQGTKLNGDTFTGPGTVGSYTEDNIIAAINDDFGGALFLGDFNSYKKTAEETLLGIDAALYTNEYGRNVYISLDYGFVIKHDAYGFELIAVEDGSFDSKFPALSENPNIITYKKEGFLLQYYGMDMATYSYQRELYARLYEAFRRTEINSGADLAYIQGYLAALDALNKANSFDTAEVGKSYYTVYDSGYENSSEYYYSFERNLIITDGKNVIEVRACYDRSTSDNEVYSDGRIFISEYSLYTDAKDYFADEFEEDSEFGDYTKLGTVTITVGERTESDAPNLDMMPTMRPHTVTIDFGGKLVVDEWGGFFYFDGTTPTIGGTILEDENGKYLIYGSETILTSNEYIISSVGYMLAKKYDTSAMTKEKGEWLGRECNIYKGYYTRRGVQYEIEIYEDVETGINLYVKMQTETTNGSNHYVIYSIDNIEIGKGIGMTEAEFLALPVR